MNHRLSPVFASDGDELIVAVSVIWAALIIASMVVLQGTSYATQLLPLLIAAAGGIIVLLAGGLRSIRS